MGDADTTSPTSSNSNNTKKSNNNTPDDEQPSSSTTTATDNLSPEKECPKKLKLNGGGEAASDAGDVVGGSNKMECSSTDSGSNNNKDPVLAPPPPQVSSSTTSEKSASDSSISTTTTDDQEELEIQVMYNKNPIPLKVRASMTILQLKEMIKAKTGVDPNLQKVLLKGIAKDEQVLGDLGVGVSVKKILVIGSSIQEVMDVKTVPDDTSAGGGRSSGSEVAGNNWCSVQVHKKVIDKGLPEDVMPGILNEHDPLPPFPLHGMYSSKGNKLRLTFKLENDELWIGTKERTDKVPIGTIRNVITQPITGYEHYHILAIQMGPTEASRVFVYWVPAQYVEAIKEALSGA